MTGGAFRWSGFIEEHGLAFDGARQFVATFAANVLVRSLQRKCGPFVVVKLRWLPLCAVVALGAWRHSALSKLPTVGVRMAFFTSRRRRFEIHVNQTDFLIGWLMTIHASGCPMRTNQREGGAGVVET